MVSFSYTADTSSGSGRTESAVKLQQWNGTTWNDVEGSEHLLYHRLAGRGGTNVGWCGILDATASDGFRLQAEITAGADTVQVTSVSLNIMRL